MSTKPILAAIDMGYGHLRPAAALSGVLGTDVLQMDLPPLGNQQDREFWERTRKLYEPLTRFSQLPGLGPPMRALLNTITAIPSPWPARDLSAATQGTRWLQRAARDGIGRTLAERLRDERAPLLTTFYAAAILAELHGATRLHCLVTDSDINRVWAPPEPLKSGITYFTPSDRAARRLLSYGVKPELIRRTGFPLPDALVGRDRAALKRNLAGRLARLDRRGLLRERAERELGPLPEDARAPLIVFAVGGAGAQVPLARSLVRGLRAELEQQKLRLALVAGRRPEVAEALREALYQNGLDGKVDVLFEPDVFEYFRRFEALLAEADALWSKPSEITFYAALGLPIICAPPVGVHESWNLRWAQDRGAALPQHEPALAGGWLTEWCEDGVLASAAWAGFTRLPSQGVYEIASAVLERSSEEPGQHA